ncbi:ECF RNA polymerase sigma factor RpoE [BD1-7 clade bacterium]|uniref:ECF RNA polymerase sigma factor RpoE n=1 Tax=BD1-7 clade bacterium TaxID=2029982 RepID=A0A5S9R013_9GAMM|nr:ECF RNA polymerase sigma factor RpoE [BD1-7 clade bacterium]
MSLSTLKTKTAMSDDLKLCMQKVAQERCERSFAILFDHFAPRLKAYSLAAQPGAALIADELVQEVLVKVWNKAHTYNPEKAAVSTWIFTLARNARIDYLRKNGRYLSEIDPDIIFDKLEDESADPFADAQQRNAEDSVRHGMNQLPSDQAQALAKVYLEGKSHQEAADEMGLPLGTVKSRVRLALSKLEVLVRR